MAAHSGINAIEDGLVFAYDMQWNDRYISKSYKGKPTINYAWAQNPRIDSSYTQYVYTVSGSWPDKHLDAITVYNKAGGNISAYVNTGVTDYTNTYHAIWTYDDELKRPVVTMRNYDSGQWKAKSFSLGKTYTDMGLTNGDTYTISWLQWTDNISRSALAGIYGTNTSAVNGFHDGQSSSKPTSFNTKSHTWQRVYATFTIAATNNLATTRSCYMYGQYSGAGTLKIADVQIETGGPSGFLYGNSEANSTRPNTQTLLDWTGNNTITADSLTYNSDGTFSFVGVGGVGVAGDYISCGNSSAINFGTGNFTLSFIAYRSSTGYQGGSYVSKGDGTSLGFDFRDSTFYIYGTTGLIASMGFSPTLNVWQQHDFVFDRASSPYIKYYLNGVYNSSSNTNNAGNIAASINTSRNLDIARSQAGGVQRYFNGSMPAVKLYNRALSAAEVAQNFNALRGRYGI